MDHTRNLTPPVREKATLVYSPHPILVDAGRVIQHLPAYQGETLGAFMRRNGVDTAHPLIVTVDGREVARDEWELLDAEPGQLVAARAALAGGKGGGSNVLQLVAVIALAVVAPYAAGMVASSMFSGAVLGGAMSSGMLAFATGVVGAVITVAGSMLINKLFPPPKMDLGRASSEPKASPTYAVSGGQNQARAYEPLAVVLGTHRVFFDLASRPYTTFSGDDQYLHQLFCIGVVGPHGAYDVSDLRIGETLLSEYEEVTTEMTVGTLPAMFPANVDTVAGGVLEASGDNLLRTTSANTRRIEVDVIATAFHAGDDGTLGAYTVSCAVEYRPTGSGGWTSLANISTGGNKQKPVRLTRGIDVPLGTYDVRVTRTSSAAPSDRYTADLQWSALKSYQPDDGFYEAQQFLAVKIRASGQLNGAIERLSGIVRMPTAPGEYSSNPADLFELFAKGHKAASGRALWGGQLAGSDLDSAALVAWKGFCTTKGLSFNVVLDSQRSVWDVLNAISRCGRGSPSWATGKLGALWDADDQPVVANFGMSNIKRGTFAVEYQSEDPVDEVVLSYVDAANNYEPDQVRALRPGVVSPLKSASVEVWGCTNQAMAVKECYLALAENIYRTRLVSWETDMEGLVVTRGDVVSLSHDLTQWGKSGRLVSGTAAEVTLDQDIDVEAGNTWITIIHPEGEQHVCRVGGADGTRSTITLLDPLPESPDDDNPMDWRYTADYLATPGKLVKIVNIVPSMRGARIQAVDEYDEYYQAENGSYTPPARRVWQSNAPQLRNLAAAEEQIMTDAGGSATRLAITWDESGAVASRQVRYSLDDGPFVLAGSADSSRYDLLISAGAKVEIVVTLYDGAGQTSPAATASVTHMITGATYGPAAPSGLALEKPWTGRTLTLVWNAPGGASASHTYRVELWSAGVMVMWAPTAVARFEVTNAQIIAAGGGRSLAARVYAVDARGRLSTGYASLAVTNPAPAAPSGLSTEVGPGQVSISAIRPDDADLVGMVVWMHTSASVPTDEAHKVYQGADNAHMQTGLQPGVTMYFRVAFYDDFGLAGINPSSSVAATPTATGGILSVETLPANPAAVGGELAVFLNVPDPAQRGLWGWNGTAWKFTRDGANLVANSVTAAQMSVSVLSAISANLGTMTAGNFTLDATGWIRGGAASWVTGKGFWQGYHDGNYKWRVGTPGGSGAAWDGTNFTIFGSDGSVTLQSGGSVSASWASIFGPGKPQDNATVGANASNFTGRIGGDNLAPNSDFAKFASGYPEGWWLYSNTPGMTVTPQNLGPAGPMGTNAFRVIPNINASSNFGIFTRSTSTNGRVGGVKAWTPGLPHVVSFYARTEGAGVGQTMYGLYSNMQFDNIERIANPPLALHWQRYVFRGTPRQNVNTSTGELYLSYEVGTPAGAFPAGAPLDFAAIQVQLGDVPTDWALGAWDAERSAGLAAEAAATAQTAATNAASSANTANALLADIAADNKLTPVEKKETKREWDAIVGEKSGINAQATSSGITTENTAYNTAYNTLNTYLTPLLSNLNTTSDIVGTTFRSNFTNLYNARQALLNKIADVADSKADAADAKAVVADGKAVAAQTAATNAASAAADAQTSANAANALLADIAADAKLTPVEKKQTKVEWDAIVAEKSGINAQASALGITTENTAYNTAYNTLNTYITPLLANLNTTSDIVATTFRSNFTAFYSSRQALMNKLADVAAQRAAWSEVSGKTGFATIDKITAGNVTTFIDNAAFGNAQIGGNLWSTNYSAGSAGWLINRNGSAEFRNVTVRGDVEASSLKADTAMVETLHIQNEAVTVPRSVHETAVSYLDNHWVYVLDVNLPTGTTFHAQARLQVDAPASVSSGNGILHFELLGPGDTVLDAATLRWQVVAGEASSFSISLSGNGTAPGVYRVRHIRTGLGGIYEVRSRSILVLGTKGK